MHIFIRMRRFLLTLDTIDIFVLVYLNLCMNYLFVVLKIKLSCVVFKYIF